MILSEAGIKLKNSKILIKQSNMRSKTILMPLAVIRDFDI